MSRKLFGIGLNKTGTTSIAKALEILGCATRHDSAANERSAETGRWPAEFRAFLDGPIHLAKWRLAKDFPDALFIQTIRPQDDWINSRILHVLHNRLRNDGDPWTDIDTGEWAREWQEWNDEAFRFRGKYPRRVLLWDVTKNPNWEPLCRFLGCGIPSTPFPHENSGTWRAEKILELLRERTRN